MIMQMPTLVPHALETGRNSYEEKITAIETSQSLAKDRDLAERQSKDQKLGPIIRYLKDGILSQSEKKAKELVLNKGQYVLIDNVLYIPYCYRWYPENCSPW